MTDSVDLPNNGQSAPFENDTQQTQPPAELRENSTESQPAPQTESQPVASFAQNAFENSTEVSTDANSEEKQLPRISEAQTRESQIQPEESAAELAEEDFQLNEADENLLDETYTESVQDFQENNSEGYELQNNVAPEGNTIVVRYGVMQFVGEFRHNLAVVPTIGSKVVVRTERGVELGEVLMPVFRTEDGCGSCVRKITGEHLQKYLSKCGPEHPFRRQGKVLRTANQQDIIDFRHLSLSADEAAKFCRENIARFKLNMKLVKVEHLLGGGRIIFYFTAEQRVDFRELVKTLAGQFRTRIEMRQVGARDEARLVGDYERCGQRCCCQQFLKNLKPVSMKMAKVQKATLDPSKISGRCGRLMCCLRYEDEGYEELRKRLPRRGIWVRLEDGAIGKVVDTQILTQLVKIELPNREFEAVNVDEIAERDIPQPSEQELEDLARKPREKKEAAPIVAPVTYFSAQTMMEVDAQLDVAATQSNQAENPPSEQAESERGEEKHGSRRRRHGRNRKPGGDKNFQPSRDAQQQQKPENTGESQPHETRENRSKHKRRHHHYSKRPHDNNGQANQQQGSAGGE